MTDPNLIERLQLLEETVDPLLIAQWRRDSAREYQDLINNDDFSETYQNYIDRRLTERHTAMISLGAGENPVKPEMQGYMGLFDNIHWEGELDD